MENKDNIKNQDAIPTPKEEANNPIQTDGTSGKKFKKGKQRSILIRDPKDFKPTPTDPALKKYKTFTNSSKQSILNDMKKKVMPHSTTDFDQKKDSKDLLRALGKVELNDYNILLADVLNKHLGSFNATTKNLTLWRRKIKNWLQNISKPEKRGGVLVSEDKFAPFRVKLVEILTNMQFRVFSTLRERILVVLEEVYNQEQEEAGRKCYKPFNRNTCSKHWWFNFQRRYPEIKKLWERLPLERSVNKNALNDDSPEDQVMSDPIFKKFASESPVGLPDMVKKEAEPLTTKMPFMPIMPGLSMPNMPGFDPALFQSLFASQMMLSQRLNENAIPPPLMSMANTNKDAEIKIEASTDVTTPVQPIQPVKVLQPITQPSFKSVSGNPITELSSKITPNVSTPKMVIPQAQRAESPQMQEEIQKPQSPPNETPKSVTDLAREAFGSDMLAKINEIVMSALLANKDKILGGAGAGTFNPETEIIQKILPSAPQTRVVEERVVLPSAPGTRVVEERVVTTETKTVYRTVYENTPAEESVSSSAKENENQ